MFDPNNFSLSSMLSFQNVWPIKRKAVYTVHIVLYYFSIYSFIALIRLDQNLRISTCIILVNFKSLQEARNVASAAKFHRLPPDKEKTVILQGRGGPPEMASQKV